MKYKLEPIEVTAANPFQHDVLDRKAFVQFVALLIERLSGPFVLAIDAEWGSGKTTLVQMLQAELQRLNFKSIYFNAWKVDYISDPLIPLVAEIDELRLTGETSTAFAAHMQTAKKLTTAVARRGLVAAAKVATLGALDLDEEVEAVAAELAEGAADDLVDAFKRERDALERLRAALQAALSELQKEDLKPTLVFFVDELDRCRPSFAVETLERIKHLFDIPNIIFVLSIDKTQLESGISAVYGNTINASEYLRRFIDLEFGVPNVANGKAFTQSLLTRFELDEIFAQRKGEVAYDKENFVQFFSALADAYRLSLRAQERCITRLCVVMDQTPSNHYLDPVLVALLIVVRATDPEQFKLLCSGLLSPRQMVGKLRALPAGERLFAGRAGIVLETYLLACDPDSARAEAEFRKLEGMAKNSQPTPDDQRAAEIIQFWSRLNSGIRALPRLTSIGTKVDLAAYARD